jgi:UDP-N-acetylmuramoylalanine--D-glutamate ligase
LRPDAATVLNLSEDHLDRYDGMAGYGAAKARIFAGAATCIVNRDDAATVAMLPPGAHAASFGLNAAVARHRLGPRRCRWRGIPRAGRTRLLAVSRLPLAGLHNAANALAALALARAIGLDEAPLLAALTTFRGLPHRVEFVDEIGGRRFYDDSKGTNVGATVAALTGMREPVVLIAGGDGKGQDFSPLGPAAAAHARAVVLIGRDRDRIAEALAPHAVVQVRAADMDEAVRSAFDVSHGRRCRAAVAGVRELRHVPQLRAPRRRVPRAVAHLKERQSCSPTR